MDLLEFKEFLLGNFLNSITTIIFDKKPDSLLIFSINSSKPPMNLERLFDFQEFYLNKDKISIAYQFFPDIYQDFLNFPCFLTWHIEWLKNLPNIPPFQDDFHPLWLKAQLSMLKNHNLIRQCLIHGIRAFDFRAIPSSNEGTDEFKQKLLEHYKYNTDFIRCNERIIRASIKNYDPLILGYYHPYSHWKDIMSSISSLDFGFKLDFSVLQAYYKSYLQLTAKHFLHYQVKDLQKISPSDLQNHPYLLIYFLSWMDHQTMEKLCNYVEHGGIIFSIGEIPNLDEYFELDYTLSKIYLAEVKGESNYSECTWTQKDHNFNLENVNHLYEYEMQTIDNLRILAHEGNFEHIFAFSREYGMGKVIHTGILYEPTDNALRYLIALLEEGDFPTKQVHATQECLAIQTISPNEERLILIGNQEIHEKRDVSFSFYNPNHQFFSGMITIDNVNLPPKLYHIWHANLKLSQNVLILLSTAEIYHIQKGHIYGCINLLTIDQSHNSPPQYSGRIIIQANTGTLNIAHQIGQIKEIINSPIDHENKSVIRLQFFGECEFEIGTREEIFTFHFKTNYIPGE